MRLLDKPSRRDQYYGSSGGKCALPTGVCKSSRTVFSDGFVEPGRTPAPRAMASAPSQTLVRHIKPTVFAERQAVRPIDLVRNSPVRVLLTGAIFFHIAGRVVVRYMSVPLASTAMPVGQTTPSVIVLIGELLPGG